MSSPRYFTGYISVCCIKNLSFPGACTDSVGGTPYKMYLLSATSNMLWEWRCATTDDLSRWNSPFLWKKHARMVNSKLDMSDSSVLSVRTIYLQLCSYLIKLQQEKWWNLHPFNINYKWGNLMQSWPESNKMQNHSMKALEMYILIVVCPTHAHFCLVSFPVHKTTCILHSVLPITHKLKWDLHWLGGKGFKLITHLENNSLESSMHKTPRQVYPERTSQPLGVWKSTETMGGDWNRFT